MQVRKVGGKLPKGTEAEQINNLIEEDIKRDALRRKERKGKDVKVMLLGQAESGKSTLQKQFQLHFASHTLDHERPSWRPVVYFNVIKAVRMMFDELDYEFMSSDSTATAELASLPGNARAEIAHLRSSLLPLVALEDSLASELSGGVHVAGGKTGVYVRSGWQALVTPNRSWRSSTLPPHSTTTTVEVVANMVAKTLSERQSDLETLWRHPAVKTLLRHRKLRLDESAPFFLDHMDRIAQPDYLPSTGDILNVRLQTLGVKEHHFDIKIGTSIYNWIMYDVGGAVLLIFPSQRHAWVPYFDDAKAVIFLAPISAFDQYLEEDPRTNRIDDSLQLFTAICSNKLLKKAHLVVMLNKADLLRKKLEAGIKVRKFITSFGDRPNTYEEVSEYFRAHFIQTHRRKDIGNRALYMHFTTMLDVDASQRIVANVGEAIIRAHIAQVGLL
ncbi:hypothetical protein PLICRDRAFT_103802 [Plicaturopsis crispa FD-325 SS-3]|nr:hypothetical protein PLICRDRAFT_103802 [Plicaturopsis crispa FD-325 SS-3]